MIAAALVGLALVWLTASPDGAAKAGRWGASGAVRAGARSARATGSSRWQAGASSRAARTADRHLRWGGVPAATMPAAAPKPARTARTTGQAGRQAGGQAKPRRRAVAAARTTPTRSAAAPAVGAGGGYVGGSRIGRALLGGERALTAGARGLGLAVPVIGAAARGIPQGWREGRERGQARAQDRVVSRERGEVAGWWQRIVAGARGEVAAGRQAWAARRPVQRAATRRGRVAQAVRRGVGVVGAVLTVSRRTAKAAGQPATTAEPTAPAGQAARPGGGGQPPRLEDSASPQGGQQKVNRISPVRGGGEEKEVAQVGGAQVTEFVDRESLVSGTTGLADAVMDAVEGLTALLQQTRGLHDSLGGDFQPGEGVTSAMAAVADATPDEAAIQGWAESMVSLVQASRAVEDATESMEDVSDVGEAVAETGIGGSVDAWRS